MHMLLAKTHLRSTDRLKVKGQKKISHASGNEMKAQVTILTQQKIDFKTQTVMRQRKTLHNDKRNNSTSVNNT